MIRSLFFLAMMAVTVPVFAQAPAQPDPSIAAANKAKLQALRFHNDNAMFEHRMSEVHRLNDLAKKNEALTQKKLQELNAK